jgi:toxin-antitoxin system PIN domain toxin
MRALLDASALIALLDTDHAFNEQATEWFLKNREFGWATCPLTENAVLRVLTHPGYSILNRFSILELRSLLRNNIQQTDHQFWPDDISLLDDKVVRVEYVLGPRQLTDVYLLALAVKNGGRLVTFDEKISVSAVLGAVHKNLCVI